MNKTPLMASLAALMLASTAFSPAALAQANSPAAPEAQPAAPLTEAAPAMPSAPSLVTGAIQFDRTKALSADDLTGMDVAIAAGDSVDTVGEIQDFLLTADGKVDQVIIQSGGVMGVGAAEVLVPLADLTFSATADQPAMLAWDRQTWDAARDAGGEVAEGAESASGDAVTGSGSVITPIRTSEVIGADVTVAGADQRGDVTDVRIDPVSGASWTLIDPNGAAGLTDGTAVAVPTTALTLTRAEGDLAIGTEIAALSSATAVEEN